MSDNLGKNTKNKTNKQKTQTTQAPEIGESQGEASAT